MFKHHDEYRNSPFIGTHAADGQEDTLSAATKYLHPRARLWPQMFTASSLATKDGMPFLGVSSIVQAITPRKA